MLSETVINPSPPKPPSVAEQRVGIVSLLDTTERNTTNTEGGMSVVEAARSERVSNWNIEVTPEIAEAVDSYFEQENTKIAGVKQQLSLLSWAEEFRRDGALIPSETSDPNDQSKRAEMFTKLEALGCDPNSNFANDLPYRVDRKLAQLYSKAGNIYADAVLPITFLTDAELQAADQLSADLNALLHMVKQENAKSVRPLSFFAAELTDISITASAQKAQADLQEQLDIDTTIYAHTTNFLDECIRSGNLSPRTDDRVATTGGHSVGVHFSRNAYETARFGFDGPGMAEYLRQTGRKPEDLLRGDIIFPLGDLIQSAPVRAEDSTPIYKYETNWGDTIIGPLNLADDAALEGVKPGSAIKQTTERAGTTVKQAGDTLFFTEGPEAYDYAFPIQAAYLIVKDEADGERARTLLSEAGHSADWIAEHLVVDHKNSALDEVQKRLHDRPVHIVAPLTPKVSPNEYRDYTHNEQYNSQAKLTALPASTVEELVA